MTTSTGPHQPVTLSEALHKVTRARVVLADDDPDMRALIAEPLRRRGHTVLELENGAALLEYLGTHEHEKARGRDEQLVVITDIRMPGYDGLTILGGMRQAGWRVPVIIISALEDTAIYDQASHLSAVALFQKPFDVVHLCNVVDQVAYARSRQAR